MLGECFSLDLSLVGLSLLRCRYYFQSAVGLPVVDIRQWVPSNRKASPVQKTTAIIFSPLSFVFVLVALFGLLVIAILSVYLPFVVDFSEGYFETTPVAFFFLVELISVALFLPGALSPEMAHLWDSSLLPLS